MSSKYHNVRLFMDGIEITDKVTIDRITFIENQDCYGSMYNNTSLHHHIDDVDFMQKEWIPSIKSHSPTHFQVEIEHDTHTFIQEFIQPEISVDNLTTPVAEYRIGVGSMTEVSVDTNSHNEQEQYLEHTRETAVYPDESGVEYTALGLNDEAGEVAGAVKKYMRKDYDEEEMRERVKSESGDVLRIPVKLVPTVLRESKTLLRLWYLTRLLDELGMTLQEVREENAGKVLDRKRQDKIRGDGDNR